MTRAIADALRARADALVARSASHNEIVTADWDDALADALCKRADGCVDTGEVVEYWDDDGADGSTWRVHLERTSAEDAAESDAAEARRYAGRPLSECDPEPDPDWRQGRSEAAWHRWRRAYLEHWSELASPDEGSS